LPENEIPTLCVSQRKQIAKIRSKQQGKEIKKEGKIEGRQKEERQVLVLSSVKKGF
jgi:hypothetical protein